MRRKKIVGLFIFALISAAVCNDCAGAKFNAYSKNSGYLPVSQNNRDATVVVIMKDAVTVPNSLDTTAIIDILNKKFHGQIQIDDLQIFMNENTTTFLVTAHGSGVIISSNEEGSHILTNWHVASADDGKDWPFICVSRDMNEACPPVLVVAKNKNYDLAVIYSDDFKREKTVKIGLEKKSFKPAREIYNWGFPIWYKKTLGYGYIATPASPESFFGAGLRLLGQLPDGPGTSGSGIFDAKTHLFIGLMQGSASYNQFTIHYFIPSTYIKEFLDKNGIPHRTN